MRPPRINLASTRLAVFLIGLVAVQILLSAIVPQRDIAAGQIIGWRRVFGPDNQFVTKLWLDRIYYSPVFAVSLALLGVNLVAGNVRRFRSVAKVERTLFRARHLGSIVFHLALLLVVAGVLLNNLFRFSGTYGLTEGQEVADLPRAYMRQDRGMLRGEESGRFRLRLEKLDRFRAVGDAVTEEARVSLTPASGGIPVTGGVRINKPLKWEDLEIHLGGATGYSPELVVLDGAGRQVFRSFVRLRTGRREAGGGHEDYILLEDGRLRIDLMVEPHPAEPSISLRRMKATRDGRVLFEGPVAPEDTVAAGELRMTIPRVRNWCYLQVLSNPLLWLVFTGFWTGLAGMAISVVARVAQGRERKA